MGQNREDVCLPKWRCPRVLHQKYPCNKMVTTLPSPPAMPESGHGQGNPCQGDLVKVVSIQKDGNWYVVRFWKDVEGQEKRQRVREKICPISGLGKLSASERERKAKEIIVASGADSMEHFEKVVLSIHGITFREPAAIWLNQVKDRKRKPLAPSTVENWESHLEKWINPNIGDLPLGAVNNLAMKELVVKMVASGELGPKSVENYTHRS
jgi:hypothetical protein